MTVRHYRSGDETLIQSLFQKTFDQEMTFSTWKWKFIDNPKQKQPFILVYEENGHILGHISLWVTDAFINGEKKKIGLRVDTMVDPDARGKGIYKKLNTSLIEEADQAGIDFLYGFPAPKAKELFLRYTGGTHMTDMPRWMYVQKPMSLLASKFKPLKLLQPLDRLYTSIRQSKQVESDYEIRTIHQCDETFDQLAELAKHQSHAMIVRDSQYLNWRFFDHPTKDYVMQGLYREDELQGYVVTHQAQGAFHNGLIIDWLAIEEATWPHLLHHAMNELHQTDVIQTWALTHTTAAKALKAKGFVHKDSPMPLVGKEVAGHAAELNDAEKWFITPGDVDSF
ncbi:GNAT family N-acetyltransferase [Halobacillus sp. H74]|uniref:GNAT family N-acetyltransferase n=1 Tax=Halobacillus sp. H74 TaxID=3457436 RepID=UPI003FCD5771